MSIWKRLFGRSSSAGSEELDLDKALSELGLSELGRFLHGSTVKLLRGSDLGCYVDQAGKVEYYWVSEEQRRKPLEGLVKKLHAHALFRQQKGECTLSTEVFSAYDLAEEWGCLQFKPVDEGGYRVDIDEVAFMKRAKRQST